MIDCDTILASQTTSVALADFKPLKYQRYQSRKTCTREIHMLGAAPTAIEPGGSEFAYSVHRADLHDTLTLRMEAERLHLADLLPSVDNTADDAETIFKDGRQIEVGLLVGADGLCSVVRRCLDATPMIFLNVVVHRTVAPASPLPAGMPNDRFRLRQGERSAAEPPTNSQWGRVSIGVVVSAIKPPEVLWSLTNSADLLSLWTVSPVNPRADRQQDRRDYDSAR